jgi:hypothetical protein
VPAPDPSRVRRRRYLIALPVAALVAAGCSDSAVAHLGQPAGTHWTGDSLQVNEHRDWLIGSMVVCLDRAGSVTVTVTGVTAYGGDVAVTGFALRPNPFPAGGQMLGSAVDGFAAEGLHPGPATVTVVCDSAPGAGDELVVQLHSDGQATTKAQGLAVAYTSEGQPGELKIPLGLVLCTKPANNPECEVQMPTDSS